MEDLQEAWGLSNVQREVSHLENCNGNEINKILINLNVFVNERFERRCASESRHLLTDSNRCPGD